MKLGNLFRRKRSPQPTAPQDDEWYVPHASAVHWLELDRQPPAVAPPRQRVARGTATELELLDAIDDVEWMLSSLRREVEAATEPPPARLADGTDAFIRVSRRDRGAE